MGGGKTIEAGIAIRSEALGDPPRLDLAEQPADRRPRRRADADDVLAADREYRAPPRRQRAPAGLEFGLVAAVCAAPGPGDCERVAEGLFAPTIEPATGRGGIRFRDQLACRRRRLPQAFRFGA